MCRETGLVKNPFRIVVCTEFHSLLKIFRLLYVFGLVTLCKFSFFIQKNVMLVIEKSVKHICKFCHVKCKLIVFQILQECGHYCFFLCITNSEV